MQTANILLQAFVIADTVTQPVAKDCYVTVCNLCELADLHKTQGNVSHYYCSFIVLVATVTVVAMVTMVTVVTDGYRWLA